VALINEYDETMYFVLLVSLSCRTACPIAFKLSVIGRIKIDRILSKSTFGDGKGADDITTSGELEAQKN